MSRSRRNRRKPEKRRTKITWPRVRISARALLVIPALAAGAAGLGVVAKFLLDQPVRKLVVVGAFQRVSPLQVEAAVAPELTAGFLSIDIGAVRERVREIDWIDHVQVDRSWPDTVTVRVTEHKAAARWGENGLLNTRGELFTQNAQHEFPELPSLSGPPGSEREVASRYLAVRGALVAAELDLKELGMDERGSWHLRLASGQEIRLGRRDVDERLERFFEVVAPALGADFARMKYVDLRYTNGFAVGWLGAPPPAAVAQRAEGRGRG